MLKRIGIDNFRCFTNFEFEPARVNLLLGANGTGKSSFFDAMARVVDVVIHGVDVAEAFPVDSRTRWDTRDAQRMELDVAVDDGAYWYRHFTQENPERLQPLWLSLKRVVPGFQALRLLSSGTKGRTRDLVAAMSTSGTAYEVDFSELSDGQRALVAVYSVLESIGPGVGSLMLDEPEAHIGLSEIQPWLIELDERFEDSGQVFLVSHHPEVVDYMAAGQPFLFERPDGGPARVRPFAFDRSSGLPASQQLARDCTDAE